MNEVEPKADTDMETDGDTGTKDGNEDGQVGEEVDRREGEMGQEEVWDKVFGEEGDEDRNSLSDGKAMAKRRIPRRNKGEVETGEQDGQDGQDGQVSEEGPETEGEEGRKAVTIKAPQKVTKEERQAHDCTHCPYRSWCKYCVRAR